MNLKIKNNKQTNKSTNITSLKNNYPVKHLCSSNLLPWNAWSVYLLLYWGMLIWVNTADEGSICLRVSKSTWSKTVWAKAAKKSGITDCSALATPTTTEPAVVRAFLPILQSYHSQSGLNYITKIILRHFWLSRSFIWIYWMCTHLGNCQEPKPSISFGLNLAYCTFSRRLGHVLPSSFMGKPKENT